MNYDRTYIARLKQQNKILLDALKETASYLPSLASWQTDQSKFDKIIAANDSAKEAIKQAETI